MTYYLDASAAVKLVTPEREARALAIVVDEIAQRQGPRALVSSDLLRTELVGTILQAGLPVSDAMRVLGAVVHFRVSAEICEVAGMLVGQLGIRSLDAIHLATAVSLRSTLTAVLTYDTRFAAAAENLGLRVEAPQ